MAMHSVKKILIYGTLLLQHTKAWGEKPIVPSCPQKWGFKIGWEPCMGDPLSMLGCPTGMVTGIGYYIGVFWEPCRKNSRKDIRRNKYEPEIGLYILLRQLSGMCRDVRYNTPTRDRELIPIVRRSNYIYFDVHSLMLPIGIKYYPGKKKRFAIHAGFLCTCLIYANKKGDVKAYLAESRKYKIFREQKINPFNMGIDEPVEVIDARKKFAAEWETQKEKVHSIPVKQVANYIFGFGFEIGLEYETSFGLIWNIPHFRFMTHPGNCSIAVGLGYNIGKLLNG